MHMSDRVPERGPGGVPAVVCLLDSTADHH